MVGNDDGLVIVLLGSLNHFLHTVVNSMNSLGNGIVDASVSNHITVSEVHNDEIVHLRVDGSDQLVLHFVCRHFRFQVVSGNLRTGNQYAVLTLIRLLASTIEEEGDMSIFLCLSRVQLLQAL